MYASLRDGDIAYHERRLLLKLPHLSTVGAPENALLVRSPHLLRVLPLLGRGEPTVTTAKGSESFARRLCACVELDRLGQVLLKLLADDPVVALMGDDPPDLPSETMTRGVEHRIVPAP